MFELRTALSQAHDTSPGPDGITYNMLRHLNTTSLSHLLFFFNRIWTEQKYPSQWHEAIVIPILKPTYLAHDSQPTRNCVRPIKGCRGKSQPQHSEAIGPSPHKRHLLNFQKKVHKSPERAIIITNIMKTNINL
ncbi:hypothetical protein AVEN_181470-1 [Araneus ventricosus]|uniref:Reverse transcriptase domain-containing protein n=1 Tax=Araneus ventricosus TaxID=182803 RepID=A0A4Y2SRX6_ARAVE|nr:hypothetical protein AVEN_181470-1 [Araneus ventricosus]